jgi:hypothetical protein
MNIERYGFTIKTLVQEIAALKEERSRYEAGSPESVFFGVRARELEEELKDFRIFANRYFAEQAKKGNK